MNSSFDKFIEQIEEKEGRKLSSKEVLWFKNHPKVKKMLKELKSIEENYTPGIIVDHRNKKNFINEVFKNNPREIISLAAKNLFQLNEVDLAIEMFNYEIIFKTSNELKDISKSNK